MLVKNAEEAQRLFEAKPKDRDDALRVLGRSEAEQQGWEKQVLGEITGARLASQTLERPASELTKIGQPAVTFKGKTYVSKITPTPAPHAFIAFNPLPALEDPAIRKVFQLLIERRFDTEILSNTGVYKLGENPPYVTLKGVKMTYVEFTQRMINFLMAHTKKDEDPYEVARAFYQQFVQLSPQQYLAHPQYLSYL